MVHACPTTLLFADRDLSWSESLRADLQQRGARVLTTDSVGELSEMLERSAPDLAIVGEDLQDARRGSAVAMIRNRCPHAMLVVLGAKGPEALSDVSRALGLIYHGEKPQDPHELLDVIVSAFPDRLGATVERRRRPALVMCVDDDPLYLRSLERILTHHGYRVIGFEDPERALEAVSEMRPDLAIIDIMMPGMNGLNLAEEINEGYGGRVPVVMLTARGTDEDILDGYRHGIAYYITKPCAPRTVLNIVDYLVGGLDKSGRDRLEAEL